MRVYSEARGIPPPDATTYGFCLALSLFRMAAILAGVGARAAQGNASSKTAEQVGTLCLAAAGITSVHMPVPQDSV